LIVHDDKLNLAVIGAGYVAERIHIPFLKRIPSVNVYALSDIDPDKASIAAKHRIRIFTQHYKEVLKDENIDVVDICTPPFNHAEIIAEACDRGKDIIVEKPMAMTLDEALAIEGKLRDTRVRLGLVFNMRYSPYLARVLRLVNSGAIGHLEHILVTSHTFPPEWNKWTDTRWFPEYGALYDFIPHLIDLILWISQGVPRTVICRRATNRRDNSYSLIIELELPNGTNSTAMISAEWTTSTSRRLLYFFGTNRDLYLDLQDHFAYLTSGYLTPLNRIPILTRRTFSVLRRVASGGLTRGFMIYHKLLLEDFIKSFRTGENPRISLQEGIVNTAVIDAAVKSVKQDRQIDIGIHELP